MLSLLFILVLAQRPTPPPCTVTAISGVKPVIALWCPDKRRVVLPATEWDAYGRKDVRLRIDSDAAERIAISGDIEPLRQVLTGSQRGFLLRIPRDTFIQWLNGEVESPDVRTHVYYAITGCPWAMPQERDFPCVRIPD